MKFIVAIFLTALLSFAAGLFQLPWWSFAICAFIVALAIPQRGFRAFLSAFIALFLLWGLMAAYKDFSNEHVLANRVANVLQMGNAFVLILVTALAGALVAGFAALSGSFLRRR